MPEWLEEWVIRVVFDLQGETPIDFALGIVTAYGHRGLWHLENDGTGEIVFGEDDFASCAKGGNEYHRHLVAERLQEAFVESENAFGQARPACPGHPHPAVLTKDGRWICPRTSRHLADVGTMTPPRA
jgi:hypothetical protein